MRTRVRTALLPLLALALSACGNDETPAGGALIASLQVTVAPNPIATSVDASGTSFTARWTTTIKEVAGLGGELEFVNAALFNDSTGALIAVNNFDDKDLVVFVGRKRLDANASLDVAQQISYSGTARVAASLAVTVRMRDDRGNVVEQGVLVKVN